MGCNPRATRVRGDCHEAERRERTIRRACYRADRSLKKQSSFPQAHGLFPEKISGTPSLETLCLWLKGPGVPLSAPSCLLLSPRKALINFPVLPGCYLAPPGQPWDTLTWRWNCCTPHRGGCDRLRTGWPSPPGRWQC